MSLRILLSIKKLILLTRIIDLQSSNLLKHFLLTFILAVPSLGFSTKNLEKVSDLLAAIAQKKLIIQFLII